MTVTIHQPEHLIWLGLVDKISKADIFAILDNVQFRKNYYQNRNKIRTNKGWRWLTVPVKKHPLKTKIIDIEISANQNWKDKYLDLIRKSYEKTKYFGKYYPKIEKIIFKKHKYLGDLNCQLIDFVLASFGVRKKIVKASRLKLPKVRGGGSNMVLAICKKLSADTYLSGASGQDYLKISDFKANKIDVIFHDFTHPQYKQLGNEFISGMSSIDLLFNYGLKAKDVLFGVEKKGKNLS